MSCCRPDAAEILEAKLLDIESYSNYNLGILGCRKLVSLQEDSSLYIFCRDTDSLLGVLTFIREASTEKYSVVYKTLTDNSITLCTFRITLASKKIGYLLANSLSQL